MHPEQKLNAENADRTRIATNDSTFTADKQNHCALKYLFISGFLLAILAFGCSDPASEETSSQDLIDDDTNGAAVAVKPDTNEDLQVFAAFLPKGSVIFDTVCGDLNKDGAADCVLIIKGTDPGFFVDDEYRGRLDRNRRGILVLLNKNGNYELIVKNYSCFSSENEDGGVYYAPELDVEILNGNLYVNYLHGRYGYWKYTFRYQNADLELIGYDASSSRGPVINSETSINFLTKKKQEKVNVNENAEGGDEIFEETWTDVAVTKLIRLSEIENFDELDTSQW